MKTEKANILLWGRRLFAAAMVASLAACGGGGGSAGGSGGTVVNTTVKNIELSASAATVGTGATSNITITATAKNAGNATVSGETVSFSVNSGTISPSSVVTDDTGTATATFSPGTDKSNRTVTVNASVGSVKGSIVINITGSRIELVVDSTTLQLNSAAARISIKAVDSEGNAIPNQTLAVASKNGNILGQNTVTTDLYGATSIEYTPRYAGEDVVSVSGFGASSSISMNVENTPQILTFVNNISGTGTVLPSAYAVGTTHEIFVKLTNNGIAVPNASVNFSTTRGSVSPLTAVTNAYGVATASVLAASAGPAVFTVRATVDGKAISNSRSVSFISQVASSVTVQANPNNIAPNQSGSDANRSTLTSYVRDVHGNPVTGARVVFSVEDVNGGYVTPSSVTTNAEGRAQASFIAGTANLTGNDQVSILAYVEGTDPLVSATTTMTVNSKALYIRIAESNVIEIIDDSKTINSMPFTVYVTDAAGNAIAGQAITLNYWPEYYAKGYFIWNGKRWEQVITAVCPNEDINQNGFLEPGEDVNGNGTLEPGAVGALVPGSVVTDTVGFADFHLRYAKNLSMWIPQGTLTASTTISGSETKMRHTFALPGIGEEYSEEGVSPPGNPSPFGHSANCDDPY